MTAASITRQLEVLKPTALQVTNHILGMGKGLPVPRLVQQDLAQTRLFTYYRFVMVESNPRLQRTVRDKVLEITEELQKEMLSYVQS